MDNCCKYCLEDNKESDHPLIYPCQCADGVHPNCLAIWLLVRPASNDKCRCEICHVNYIGVIIPPLTHHHHLLVHFYSLYQMKKMMLLLEYLPHLHSKEIPMYHWILYVVNANGMRPVLILWVQYLD